MQCSNDSPIRPSFYLNALWIIHGLVYLHQRNVVNIIFRNNPTWKLLKLKEHPNYKFAENS